MTRIVVRMCFVIVVFFSCKMCLTFADSVDIFSDDHIKENLETNRATPFASWFQHIFSRVKERRVSSCAHTQVEKTQGVSHTYPKFWANVLMGMIFLGNAVHATAHLKPPSRSSPANERITLVESRFGGRMGTSALCVAQCNQKSVKPCLPNVRVYFQKQETKACTIDTEDCAPGDWCTQESGCGLKTNTFFDHQSNNARVRIYIPPMPHNVSALVCTLGEQKRMMHFPIKSRVRRSAVAEAGHDATDIGVHCENRPIGSLVQQPADNSVDFWINSWLLASWTRNCWVANASYSLEMVARFRDITTDDTSLPILDTRFGKDGVRTYQSNSDIAPILQGHVMGAIANEVEILHLYNKDGKSYLISFPLGENVDNDVASILPLNDAIGQPKFLDAQLQPGANGTFFTGFWTEKNNKLSSYVVDRHPLHIYKNNLPPLDLSPLKGDRLLGGYAGYHFFIAHMNDNGRFILSRFNVYNGAYEKSWDNCIIVAHAPIALNEAYQLVSNGEGDWYLGKVSEMLGYIPYPEATDWLAPYFGSNNATKKLNIFWNKKVLPHSHKGCPHIGAPDPHDDDEDEDIFYDIDLALMSIAGVFIVFGCVVVVVPCVLKTCIPGHRRVGYESIGRERCRNRAVRILNEGASSERGRCSGGEEVRGAGDSASLLEMQRIRTATP